jgi:hypothetical protein
MNCELAEEYVSALCDGQKIPQVAAEHLGKCRRCQLELNEYAAIGAELRRLASLDESAPWLEGCIRGMSDVGCALPEIPKGFQSIPPRRHP